VLKSKIRNKLLKTRKNSNKKNIKIKFDKIYKLLKKTTNLRNKIVGGYYPVNYEIDDLDILGRLEKKKITISLPSIKKNYKMNFIKCSLNVPSFKGFLPWTLPAIQPPIVISGNPGKTG